MDKLTDMQVVLELIKHIENPCTVEVKGRIRNIRDFYLRESQSIRPKLTNPFAKEMLEETINKYRKNFND